MLLRLDDIWMIFIHAVHKIYKFFDEQLLVQMDI